MNCEVSRWHMKGDVHSCIACKRVSVSWFIQQAYKQEVHIQEDLVTVFQSTCSLDPVSFDPWNLLPIHAIISLCYHLSFSKTSSSGSYPSYSYDGQHGFSVQLYKTQTLILLSVCTTKIKTLATFFMRVDILIIPHCLWSESKQEPV